MWTYFYRRQFLKACRKNQVERVIVCCRSRGLDVNTVSKDGWSGLVVAARYNSEAVVAWLLAQPGVQVNLATADGGLTALMVACAAGHPDIVRRLVQAPGVDLNMRCDGTGWTAAHWAAIHSAACVEVLARVPGLDWNVDSACWLGTPLCCAVRWGNSGSVRALLSIPGVDLAARDSLNTPLSYLAVTQREAATTDTEVVRLLAGLVEADWNYRDLAGDTPLMVALKDNMLDIAKVLIQSPLVNVTIPDFQGQTPEMFARYPYQFMGQQ